MMTVIACAKSTNNLPSLRRQWVNWVVVLLLQFLIVTAYWTLLPSMHQFITNPKKPELEIHHPDEQKLWPGLGDSEYIYSWIVTAYPIGEVVGAGVTGIFAIILPYHISIPISCAIEIASGLLYALTVNSFMIFTSRFLSGFFVGVALVLLNSYIGESTERYAEDEVGSNREKKNTSRLKQRFFENKEGKRTRKDMIYILYAFVIGFTAPLGLGIASVIAHFPNIHQFRWPGWFMVASTSVYVVVFVVVFEQPRRCYNNKVEEEEEDKEKVNDDHEPPKLNTLSGESVKLWRSCKCCSLDAIKAIVVYSFLVLAGYVGGTLYTVMDTLINPILSDQFGFAITDISYFILIATVLPLVAAICLAAIKIFAIDNRMALAGALLMAVVGGLIMSDWQAIGEDPCSNFCNNTLLLNSSINDSSMDFDSCTSKVKGLSPNSSAEIIANLCEAASTSKYTCYWNPRSRITGKYCSDCTPRCNSVQKSLYFAQLCVGTTLIMISLPLVSVLVNVIASDYTPTEYQGIIMGAVFVSGGIARILSPLWSDWVYEATGKHTYAVMTIKSLSLFLVFVLLLVFYKQIAPKSRLRTKVDKSDYITTKNKEDARNKELQSHLISSDAEDSES